MNVIESFSEFTSGFFQFFSDVMWPAIVLWWQLPLPERLGKLAGAIAAAVSMLGAVRWLIEFILSTKKRMHQQIEGLKADLEQKKVEIEKIRISNAEKENIISELIQWQPSTAILKAENDRRSDNNTLAANHLISFFDKLTPALSRIARELAEHHIQQSIPEPMHHLEEALRWIRISLALDPSDEDSNALRSEIDTLRHEFQTEGIKNAALPGSSLQAIFGLDYAWSPESSIYFLRDVALALRRKGLARAALSLLKRAARVAETRLPERDLLRATTCCWEAVCLRSTGQIIQSWPKFDKNWKIIRQLYAENDRNFMVLEFERTQFLLALGKFETALTDLQSLTKRWKHNIGEDDPNTFIFIRNTAQILNYLDRRAESLATIDEIIELQIRSPHQDNPELLSAHLLRSEILLSLDRYDEALCIIDDILPVMRKSKGEYHKDTLLTNLNRARIMQILGNNHEALLLFEAIIPDMRRIVGRIHTFTLSALHDRASALECLGRNSEALVAVDELLPVARKALGDNHPSVLTSMRMRASILRSLDRNHEAITAIEYLIPIQRRVLGEEHRGTLSSLGLRASILVALERYGEALAVIDELLPIHRKVDGDEHGCTLNLVSLRYGILIAQGDAEYPIARLRVMLPSIRNAVGMTREGIATVHYRLARALHIQGRSARARTEIRAAIEILQAITGEGDPLFASAKVLADLIDGKPNDGKLIA